MNIFMYQWTIGLEFMKYAAVDNLEDALKVVNAAEAKNGGIILDIVQVENIGIAYEDISRIPLERLVCIELNDGALVGSPLYDASRARRFCGEGDFDVKGFIRCIQRMGYTGPWALEVMSKELTALSLNELNQRAYQSTMAQFEQA
jgi:sugar phosphate isomerase/epimerase